jgi:hypothetical protein
VAGLAAEGQPPVSRLVAERNGVES